jgi:hypothetical protein
VQITFDLPHVFSPDASPVENSEVLKALLDCMVSVNLAYLKSHPTPPLYRSGVVYGRTAVWNTIPAVLQLGYGDCKSLATWLVAEYRLLGVPCRPVFRWIRRASGTRDFHILVDTESGYQDPSKVLGMGKDENAH